MFNTLQNKIVKILLKNTSVEKLRSSNCVTHMKQACDFYVSTTEYDDRIFVSSYL